MLFFFNVKQGNRSSSSACGSADVLEALGIVIDLDPEVFRRDELNFELANVFSISQLLV